MPSTAATAAGDSGRARDVLRQARAGGALEGDPRDRRVGRIVHADIQHPDDVRVPQRLGAPGLGEERVARRGRSDRCGCRILSATGDPVRLVTAAKTDAEPPVPRSSPSRYRPDTSPEASLIRAHLA